MSFFTSENSREGRHANYIRAALLLLITIAVYLPAMRGGFLWDDDRYVTDNAFVQSERGLPYLWVSARTRDYYPVLYTSFWLDCRFWDSNPTGYHLTNVLLHAANAILLWLILLRMRIPGAWLCGLVFAVHPMNVESVAWISQRKNTLAMFFFLLSFLAFPWRNRSRHFGRYCTAMLLFTLSLLSKPIAIMFPVLIPVYQWWRNGTRNGSVPQDADPEQRSGGAKARPYMAKAIVASIPFFILSGMYGVMTIAFQQAHSLKGVPVGAETLPGKALSAARALMFYAGKAINPINLCSVYPEWKTDQFNVTAFLPLMLIVLTAVLLFLKRRTWGRPMIFASLYFVLMLFPVLGFLDVGFMFYAMVADHWIYPALPALLAVVIGPLTGLFTQQPERMRRIGVTLAGLLVMLLGVLSFDQARLYTDMKTLFTHTVIENPRAWVAHVVLGNQAFSEGRLAEAERHFETALREKPKYWEALNGLGIVYAVSGRLDAAIEMFSAVLDAKPEHANARRNLELARRDKAARASAERAAAKAGNN